MRFGRVRIYGSFAVLWAVLLYIDAGRLLFPVWACALLHELGHWLAVKLFGGKIEVWEFSAGGVCMRIGQSGRMGYGAEIISTLAGPLASFLCALFFSMFDGMITWSGICALQAAFNLLPAAGLDGGRAVLLALRWAGSARARLIMRITTFITALAVSAAGAFAFVSSGYNPTLLLAGAYATFSILGEFDDD